MCEPDHQAATARAPKDRWWLLVGWAVSITILLGVAHTAPVSEVAGAMRQVDLRWFVAALLLNVVSLLLRGGRWVALFSGHGKIPLVGATEVVMIGLGLNAVLPGRVGEFVRMGMGARRFGGGIAFNAATVVMERVLDAVTLLVFLGVSLLLLPAPGAEHSVEVMSYRVGGDQIAPLLRGLSVLSLLLVIAVVFVSFDSNRRRMVRLAGSLPVVGGRLGGFAGRLLDDVAKAFAVTRRPRTLARLVGYSALIWFGMALANLCVAAGTASVRLTLVEGLILTAISVAVATLPAAPGAWGIFEAGALLALVLSGVAYEPAAGLAFVLVVHLAQYVTVIGLGLVAAIHGNVTLATVRAAGARRADDDPRDSADSGSDAN